MSHHYRCPYCYSPLFADEDTTKDNEALRCSDCGERVEFTDALDAAEESNTKTGWRLNATIDRLISNIPAACKVLLEEGYVSLAGQLARDQRNLIYWQERGALTFQQHPEEPISNIQYPKECDHNEIN